MFGKILAVFSGVLGLFLVVVILDGWVAFGGRPGPERKARMETSPQWKDGHFVNPQPLKNHYGWMLQDAFRASPHTSPQGLLPTAPSNPETFRQPPPTGLRATWFGHSSVLVEVDGAVILTDPIWSERASPLEWMGPRRWSTPSLSLSELPPLDAVVISHDHYDHLDMKTVQALLKTRALFIVPLGLGAHLERWGVPVDRLVELDWWKKTTLKNTGIEIVCTPARHATGRVLLDNDTKLWAGWALVGPKHRVYYSGDTGLFPAMDEIGRTLGPFDLTLIEAGQYGRGWPDWHLGPEQAVDAHLRVRGKVMLPVHWAAFTLAYHGWTEPIERTLAEGARRGVQVASPRPGESFEPAQLKAPERWWPQLSWKTAAEDPIVSSQLR